MSEKITPKLLCLLSVMALSGVASVSAADTGAWLQVVTEGSMEFIDPSLKNGRIWLEGQSRFDGNWGRHGAQRSGLFTH